MIGNTETKMGKRVRNIVRLTDEERSELLELVKHGETHGYKTKHAQVLLALDENCPAEQLSRKEVSKVYQINLSTVASIVNRFAKGGLLYSLGRKEWLVPHIAAIASSEAPEGRERWTFRLIANELVRLGVVECISSYSVGCALRKMNLHLVKRSKNYIVRLTDEDRSKLLEFVEQKNAKGHRIKYAQVLLALDVNCPAGRLSRAEISESYQLSLSMINCIVRRFVTEGMVFPLDQKNRRSKVDEKVEAHIAAIVGSKAPEGRARWTYQQIADELIRLGVVESISATTVGMYLKK